MDCQSYNHLDEEIAIKFNILCVFVFLRGIPQTYAVLSFVDYIMYSFEHSNIFIHIQGLIFLHLMST